MGLPLYGELDSRQDQRGRDLRAQLQPILSLAIGLVLATAGVAISPPVECVYSTKRRA